MNWYDSSGPLSFACEHVTSSVRGGETCFFSTSTLARCVFHEYWCPPGMHPMFIIAIKHCMGFYLFIYYHYYHYHHYYYPIWPNVEFTGRECVYLIHQDGSCPMMIVLYYSDSCESISSWLFKLHIPPWVIVKPLCTWSVSHKSLDISYLSPSLLHISYPLHSGVQVVIHLNHADSIP